MSSSKSFLAALTKWLVTLLDSEGNLSAETRFRAAEGWELVIGVIIVYSVLLAIVTRWMVGRNRTDLGMFPTLWNIILSLCSAIGMLGVGTETFQFLTRDGGLHSCICDLEQLKTLEFLGWISYFRCLKLLELGDSMLAVVEKKPVSYLHIHHRISMLCIGEAAVFHLPATRLIVPLNLGINFLMYACLALEDSGWISKAICNIPQRLQAVPRAITLASFFYGFLLKYKGEACDVPQPVLIGGSVLDLLYFAVFLRSFNCVHAGEREIMKRD